MRPAGNSISASEAISIVPKRELSTVRVDIRKRLLIFTRRDGTDGYGVGLLQEVHERALDEARSGAQRRLEGGLLRVEVDEGLGDVGVLGVRELLRRRLLELAQPRDGRVQAVGG